MNAPKQSLLEKIKKFPRQRMDEVEDFVDCLRACELSSSRARPTTPSGATS